MLQAINQQNKQVVQDFWAILDANKTNQIKDFAQSHIANDLIWYGFDPINQLQGFDAFLTQFWQPFLNSFPNLKRKTHLFMGGQSNGRIDGDISKDGKMWVSGTGLFEATFAKDYLKIPANGKKVCIRWGEFCQIEHGKITQIYFLIDLIDLIQQTGLTILPPSRGKDGKYPPPRAKDGILSEIQEEAVSTYSLAHIRRFIFEGLNKFDQSNLKSMGMADFFHKKVKWYGPGGIGACLSFKEFEDFHQKPWLVAFPDRRVQNLDALIAEGNYSGAPGWAGVKATHNGIYLGVPPTGNALEINGLDWWKREGEQYVENWVFVDMIHLFRQFGVDLFERL